MYAYACMYAYMHVYIPIIDDREDTDSKQNKPTCASTPLYLCLHRQLTGNHVNTKGMFNGLTSIIYKNILATAGQVGWIVGLQTVQTV